MLDRVTEFWMITPGGPVVTILGDLAFPLRSLCDEAAFYDGVACKYGDRARAGALWGEISVAASC